MTWTLLHDACEKNQSAATIVELAYEYPESVLGVDDHGSTPLHLLCWVGNPDPRSVQTLLDVCPQAASDQDCHGNTPLHIACASPRADKHLLQMLIDFYPAATSTPNREGLLPLHMVCRHCPNNEQVIGLLIQTYPYALRSRIKMGNLVPKQKQNSLSLVKATDHPLIEPDARMSVNSTGLRYEAFDEQVRDGAYPLHMAIQANASVPVLEMLVKAEKDIVLKTNKYGETPLHLALKIGPGLDDSIPFLLLRCGGAKSLRCLDKNGNLPIHVAAAAGCSVHMAKKLLEMWPASIHEMNGNGLTPLDLAIQYGKCSEDVLRLFAISEDEENLHSSF